MKVLSLTNSLATQKKNTKHQELTNTLLHGLQWNLWQKTTENCWHAVVPITGKTGSKNHLMEKEAYVANELHSVRSTKNSCMACTNMYHQVLHLFCIDAPGKFNSGTRSQRWNPQFPSLMAFALISTACTVMGLCS